MLTQRMRKKLQTHDWLDIARKESNPHQTILRLKRQANRAISDLALLARKLPDDKQNQIFNYGSVEELINSIFNIDINEKDPLTNDHILKWNEYSSEQPDPRRTELAALLVKRGTDFCIKEYQRVIRPNHILSEPVLNQLLKSVEMCRAVSMEISLRGVSSLTQ